MVAALIDTAILVDLLRYHAPAIEWRNSLGNVLLGVTPMVWMETLHGAQNRTDQQRAIKILRQFEKIYLELEDQEWALIQYTLYRLSHGVGILDCLIAAPASRLKIPLYTRNLKHFEPLLGPLAQQPY